MSASTASEPFIFCVGFNKCATLALHAFFEKQGIPSIHWDGGSLARRMLDNLCEGRRIFDGYDDRFRAFSDMNFVNHRMAIEGNAFFRAMDADYPGSLFIYQTRDMAAWLESRQNHLGSPVAGRSASYLERYKSILNTADDEVVRDFWMESRWRQERELTRYFLGSSRFLVLDVDRRDVVQTLGSFLGRDLDPAGWERINVSDAATRRRENSAAI